MVTVDTLAITVPRALSVITKERVQAGRLGVTLDEALSDVPGVFVNNRYNFALGTRISMRGFGARAAFGVRGIRVIQDGIPLTMPDGQTNLNNVDLTSVGRIEVLRGAASMLEGNAAGGVIDIRSEQPPSGFMLEARAAGADLGRSGIDNLGRFNVKLAGGGQRISYLISGARVDANGSRDHSSFIQNNLTARISGARTAFTLSIADAPVAENPGSLPRDSAEQQPGMAWPRNVATRAGEQSRQLQAGALHARRVGAGELSVSAYGLNRTLDNPLPFAYITLDRNALGFRSTFALRGVTLGVSMEGQADDRAEFDNISGRPGSAQRRDQTDRIRAVAPFVRASRRLTEELTLDAGARYDHVRFEVEDRFVMDGRNDSGERTLHAFSPSAGASYAFAPNRMVFASVSTSFQTPTTTEMINTPPAAGQPCCPAGLNSVDPQRALSMELGFRGVAGRVWLDAAVYHMRIKNAIVPFQVAQVEGRAFFRNAGRTRHRGLELAAKVRITPRSNLTTSYTFSDFVFIDDGIDAVGNEGNQLPGVPAHHLVIRPSLFTRHVTFEPETELISSYFADDANSEAARNNAATIVNVRVRASRPIGKTRLTPFAAINNLTDERYNSSVVINAAGGRYFEPAPGRNFHIGLGARIAGNGPPR
ncbi:MAG: TonB-dependent receptor family protein [Gemmatimonadota bacterium]